MLRQDLRFKLETSGILVALAPPAALMADTSLLMLPLLVLPVLAVRRTAQMAVLRERQSLHDPLTGLSNRELFRRRVERALDAGRDDERGVAVLMVDMDHFKDVNDILGHHVGDQLLREIGCRIERAVGAHDEDATVARLGGDEFAIVLTDRDPLVSAERLAESLLGLLARPVDIPGQRLSVQVSIGVTTTGGRHVDVHGLLSEADIALYEAKRERGRYRVFEPGTVTGSAERLLLLPQLRDAIEGGELEVLYQPQLDVRDGRILSVEALVRWDHPVHGRLGPDSFITLAESAGLIGRLTSHVLATSVEAASGWRKLGWDVGVAVNLSARQLGDESLPREVAGLLTRWGLPASHLTIEVTESSLMVDARQASKVLRSLRDMGVRLAIDDFGTGYSSLVLLQRLDVDELKVDRSFVAGLVRGSHDEILVRSIIDLGHNLGLTVVAEGVETGVVAEQLTAMGCDRLQGYLFGRPMADEAINAVLAAQHAVSMHAQRSGPPDPPALPTVPVLPAVATRPVLRSIGGGGAGC
jgi:diguanylate cyclase (GGDEF)-like protein